MATSIPSVPQGIVPGPAYLVSGNVFAWDGSSYTAVGQLTGATGSTGPTGATGPQGPAAVGQTATVLSISGTQALTPTTAYTIYLVNNTGSVLTLPTPSSSNTGWQITLVAATLSNGNSFGLTGNINSYNFVGLGFVRGSSVTLTSNGSTWIMEANTEGLRSYTAFTAALTPATASSGSTYIATNSPTAVGTQPSTDATANLTLGAPGAVQNTGCEIAISTYQTKAQVTTASMTGGAGVVNNTPVLNPGQFSEVFSDGTTWRERATTRFNAYQPTWSMANKSSNGSRGWSYTVSARTSQDMFFPWSSSDSYAPDTRSNEDPCFTQAPIQATDITGSGNWTSPVGLYPTVGGWYRFQITPYFLFTAGLPPASFTLGLAICSNGTKLIQHAANSATMLYIPVTTVAQSTYSIVALPTYTMTIMTDDSTITAPLYFQASVYFTSSVTLGYTYYHTVAVDKIG